MNGRSNGGLGRQLTERWKVYGPTLRDRAWQYAQLMRWHRPIGALLLLWPMMWALWIAGEGRPDFSVVVIFILGVWVMRSAGCVINDFADRNIDPYVERTRDRPLASGRVQPAEALALAAMLLCIAFLLVLLTNRPTVIMAFLGAFLAASYPFTKRFTYLPQVYLGAAFGWAVPMAWTAQTGELPGAVGWLIFLTAVIWATIYDTEYAMVDREDDLKIGVKSAAILFGDLDRHIIGVLQATMLLALVLLGINVGLGIWYYLGLAMAAAMFGYQQWLIHGRERRRCFQAFMNNNWLGAAVFAGLAAHYWIG